MDINNPYQAINNMSLRADAKDILGYDLVAEKQRISQGIEEIKNEILEQYNKKYANAQIFPAAIAAIHPEVLDFLLSFGMVSVYDDIAKQAGLDVRGRNILPRIVWQIVQNKNWESLDQILEAQLPLVHSAHVTVTQLLQQNILNKVKALSEKQVIAKVVAQEVSRKERQLSLSDALSQYPKLGEQNITGDQIKLRYSPTPLRPSIKNWITDFHDSMGAGKHSPIDRGNFLFHSENGKKLSAIDRQKLGTILKSLDEQTLLTIDTDSQVVVFQNNADESQVEKRLNIDSDIEQAQIQAVRNSDINLSSTQNQQNKEVNNISFSPDFSLRKVENSIGAEKKQDSFVKKFNTSIAPDSPFNVDVNKNNAEQKTDYFSIPQSKPPIGSENFNTMPVTESPKAETIITPSVPQVIKPTAPTDRNLMDDDSLYEILQSKKGISHDNKISSDGFNFSSPQKLSAEQGMAEKTTGNLYPKRNIQQQSVTMNQGIQVAPQHLSPSPFHITPSNYSADKKETNPIVQKNVVDLRG